MFRIAIIILLVGVLLSSCEKEYSCEGCIPQSINKPPIARAGTDQSISLPLDSISLNGSASSDPDGVISIFSWRKISGPTSLSITTPNLSQTKVMSLSAGSYEFELSVTDNGGLTSKDTVQLIVNNGSTGNRPPIAQAGPDQMILLPASTAFLDGSQSSDPDNNITSYAWTRISGPSSFLLSSGNAVQTQAQNLAYGIHLFELKVTDAGGLFSRDTVQITVSSTSNLSPVSDAGRSQCTSLPLNSLMLDGIGSYDPDNSIISYQWTKISGPALGTIVNPNNVQTQVINLIQGIYLFELLVTDIGGLTDRDTTAINVFSNIVTGSEIIFDGMWTCNDLCNDGDVYWDSTPCQGGIFTNPDLLLEVYIQTDSNPNWIEVRKYNSPLPPINQFSWQILSGSIWIYAQEGRLINTPLRVKIKFL